MARRQKNHYIKTQETRCVTNVYWEITGKGLLCVTLKVSASASVW